MACVGELANIEIHSDPPITSLRLTTAWESRYYLEKVPLPVLEAETQEGPCVIRTVIRFQPEGASRETPPAYSQVNRALVALPEWTTGHRLTYQSKDREPELKQLLQDMKTGETILGEVPTPQLQPGFVKVRTPGGAGKRPLLGRGLPRRRGPG